MTGRPLCIGLSWLFDSVDPGDHLEAAAYCARCPVADWCAGEAARGEAWGTWAGVLYGRRRTARVPKRIHASARRVADEDAHYDEAAARAAHAAFQAAHTNGGEVTDWERVGERVYQRRKKRTDRAARKAVA